MSANLIQLSLFDRGDLTKEEAEASVIADDEAKIVAPERKVGQPAMELDLAEKAPRPPDGTSGDGSFIVTGPGVTVSDAGVQSHEPAAEHSLFRSTASKAGSTDADTAAVVEDIRDQFHVSCRIAMFSCAGRRSALRSGGISSIAVPRPGPAGITRRGESWSPARRVSEQPRKSGASRMSSIPRWWRCPTGVRHGSFAASSPAG